jgi:hypothetical protein
VEDFPYDMIEFLFDSGEATSAEFLSPIRLPHLDPNEAFEIRVSGLRFPATFNGAVQITVTPAQNETNPSNNSILREVSVKAASDQGYLHCLGTLIKALEELIPASKMEDKLLVDLTVRNLQSSARMEVCGENLGCAANEIEKLLDSYSEAGIEAVAGLTPQGKLALLVKLVAEAGVEGAKCGDWIWSLLSTWQANTEEKESPTTFLLAASTVNVVVTDRQGEKAGILPDGTLVEEIPDSEVISIGDDKLILCPAEKVSGAELHGTGSDATKVSMIHGEPEGVGKQVTYVNVPILENTSAMIDLSDSQYVMKIDTDGDGEYDSDQSPDLIAPISGMSPSRVSNDYLPLLALTILALNAITLLLIVVVRRAYSPRLAKRQSRMWGSGQTKPAELRLVSSGGRAAVVSSSCTTIGREQGNHIVVAERLVSRNHAKIQFDGEKHFVIDLGSTNGTQLNGHRLQSHRPYPLRHGDALTLAGQVHLAVHRIPKRR